MKLRVKSKNKSNSLLEVDENVLGSCIYYSMQEQSLYDLNDSQCDQTLELKVA